ncbi:MAG: hydrogenase formation protein HypD [Gemmatimonadetes bacterium]|uniref:Hydrogenase formation protein HypD n=1 Tax=Candidatus Kutchimonas denitrificans TaxID=3056748 RepID=A0AAE4Z9R7_9BACT|nr:hydrogenase formation protein HypD [Gemmatimonadota bacterium]NIR74751.1 hydrogenase formation protein HypD [Candidatus Kutchimonas denitrificans]NIS01501.1 hydrogenase formation protein HypD [Gemmatimonadota bacterium]NIT67242.1 hydrogenase formation protein HypD [Gemmatimonadota bacterium]NIU52416.1 hydrogenase formation protein HypD [Gemmatimonadota bacterium]
MTSVGTSKISGQAKELKFRDPAQARALSARLAGLCDEIGRESVQVMHVCGSHEQAIARYGLRAVLPKTLDLIMGPGCPVCVTDMPEVDEAVVLAVDGALIATYGDMVRVPGTAKSLADAASEGARVEVVYSASQAVELARSCEAEVVFFATGFETTAVATAAIVLQDDLPPNFSILSAHKYVPPAMEIVARIPETRVEGFLAAGHAATITGWGLFEDFVDRYGLPVVVAGFEPLDILAGLVRLVELIRDGQAKVENMYPRCVTREGNTVAQDQMWRVFRTASGMWRGIADIPNGNLRLREEFAHLDARARFDIDTRRLRAHVPSKLTERCICGTIMSGLALPTDCELFGKECDPENPVGACMVSSEGTCKIWHQYGGHPEL